MAVFRREWRLLRRLQLVRDKEEDVCFLAWPSRLLPKAGRRLEEEQRRTDEAAAAMDAGLSLIGAEKKRKKNRWLLKIGSCSEMGKFRREEG